MKIVVLSHRVPFPPNKGEKIRTFNQLEFLRKRGFDITVFCLLHEPADAGHAAEYQAITGISIITADVGFGKPRMVAGLFKLRPLSVSNFYCKALQKKLNAHIASSEIDVIYCTSSAMAEYYFKGEGSQYASTSGSFQCVIDFMDLDSDKWRQYAELTTFPLSLVYRYESKTLFLYEAKIQQKFDQCIFISANEVSLFSQYLQSEPRNLKVVGNGVDLSNFHARPNRHFDSPLTLLFSGVMDYFPNENAMCWFVENVWPLLKSEYPDARLIIAGMNPTQNIMAMADDKGITVTGYVDDMLACYHQANIFIAPFQIARGVQNKILQSFACGLPVVSTTVGAEGIDCRDNEHLLIATTPEQFLEKITQLSHDDRLYQKIGNAALDLVNQQYTWDAKNKALAEILKSVRTA